MNYELKRAYTESKMTIHCSKCNNLWMLGDRERTEEEKSKWICPNCRLLRKQGKCCQCGKDTFDIHPFADDVDEDGQPTGYNDFCCDNCFESLQEKV